MKTAVVVGATGLVGSHCIRLLASSREYDKVVALVRRISGFDAGKVIERVVDFERLDSSLVQAGSDVFCAIGTTIRKAGSQAAFRKVDLDIPVNLARVAARAGARQFSVVSSVGASPGTSNFYLRTKAEMETAVSAEPFHAVHIFRPSFLIGVRQEWRPGEKIGIAAASAIGFAFAGSLRKYRAINAATVAAAMLRAASKANPGVHVYHYDEIVGLSAGSA